MPGWMCVAGMRARCLAKRFAADESASGSRMKGVAVILHDQAAAAGVAPFTPHDMRRTYISELLDAGTDLATVQKMVGHGGATTMAGYDRRGDANRRRAADLVHVPFFPRQ